MADAQVTPDRTHTITIEQGTRRVRVVQGDQVLAESERPLLLRETGCPVRYYLPPEDVRLDLLTPSESHTHCPFKGTANYYSVPVGGKRSVNAIWTYEAPNDAVADIKDHIAFYPNRVDSITVTPVS